MLIRDALRTGLCINVRPLNPKTIISTNQANKFIASRYGVSTKETYTPIQIKHLTSLLKRFEVNMQKMWEVITAVSTKHIDGVGGELLSKLNDAGVQSPDVLINEQRYHSN